MVPRSLRATLALLSGALIGLAVPASAVAHGHAHAELLEHAADDHGIASHADHPSASESGHHEDHGHPKIDKGVSSRGVQLLPATPPPPDVPEFASHEQSVAPPAPAPFESPPGPHDRAPANPRAPPVLSAF